MKLAYRTYYEKMNALTLRERVMVYLAVTLVMVFVADALFLGPLAKRRTVFAQTIEQQRTEVAQIDAQLVELRSTKAQDPDAAAKARIRQIEERIASIDSGLRGVDRQLVPPDRMVGLLEDLLKRNRRLQLLRVKTLPLAGVLDHKAMEAPGGGEAQDDEAPAPRRTPSAAVAAAASAALGDQNIFKHGVELTLRGNYLDMLDYLVQIEALPWKMYWGKLTLDASDPARTTLVLTLYTLSLDKAWITL